MSWLASRTMLAVVVALVASVLVAAAPGCQQASEDGEAKRVPRPPPPRELVVPADTHIAVTVDGAPAPALDAARLQAATPDFSDEDRRAWKLVDLLGEPARRPGAVVAVSGKEGPEILLHAPSATETLHPVLVVSRRGDLVATMLDPRAPFPDYHGRGGRLGRGADPLPRVNGVVKIRVYIASP